MKVKLLVIGYLFFTAINGTSQPSAVENLKAALAERTVVDSMAVILMIQLGEAYRSDSLEASIQISEQSIAEAKLLNNPFLQFRAHMSIGVTYVQQIQYHIALEHFYHALDIAKMREGPEWMKRHAQALINISGVKWSTNDITSAQKHLREGMKILKTLDEPVILADNYLGGAFFFIDLQQYDSALVYLDEALKIYRKQKNLAKTGTVYSKVGDVKFKQGKFDEALEYAKRSLEITLNENDSKNIPWSHMNTAKCYQALGLKPEAIYHYRTALRLFNKANDKEGLVELHPLLVAFFEHNNQPDSALFYLKHYQTYLKEIYDADKNKLLQQLEFQYHTKEKEQENQLLRQQNSAARFRNDIYGIAAVSLLCLIVILSRFSMRLRQKKEQLQALNSQLKAANDHLKQLNTEKKFLASLLTHDLRHPLAVIQLNLHEMLHAGYASELVSEMEHAADRIDEMSRRIMDVENMEEGVMLSLQLINVDALSVLEAAEKEFQQYAAHNDIDIQIHTTSGQWQVKADPYFLQRIIGNLLSNAIKYSPSGKPVVLRLEDAGECIRFLVTDQGPGLDADDQSLAFKLFQKLKPQAEKGESSWGYGLFISRRYAEAMGGTLNLESERGRGATFILELPKA